MNVKCAYHPQNIAIDKCERCNRPICLEGKKVYHRKHSSGTGSSRRSWSTTHVYCVPCYADVVVNASTGPVAVFGGVLFILVAGFITIIFFTIAGPLGLFPLAIVIFGVYNMIQAPKRADEARKEERRFLQSLQSEPQGIERMHEYSRFQSYIRPQKKWNLTKVHCFECGEEIDLKGNFCMNCGDSTLEEKEYLERKLEY